MYAEGQLLSLWSNEGLTLSQLRVIRTLTVNGEMSAGELASVTELWAPSISRLLVNLSERGLVTRRTDPADARRTLVAVTKAGRELNRDLLIGSVFEAAVASMSETDQQDLQRLLVQLTRRLEAATAGRSVARRP